MIALVSAGIAGTVQGASMTFSWAVEDGVLTGRASAPAAGWVAVGIHDRPGLPGTVLLMARPDGLVEEHVAHPPKHPPRATPGLLSSDVGVRDGRRVFTFRWSMDNSDGLLPELAVGEPVWFTLAWSREDAFDHHSAERIERSSTL